MNYRSVLRMLLCVCLRELMKMNEKYEKKIVWKLEICFFSSILWAVAFSVIRACFARERAATAFGRNEEEKKPNHQASDDLIATHTLFARWTSHLLGCRWSSFVSVYTFLLWVWNRSLYIFRKRLDKRTKRWWWKDREREGEKTKFEANKTPPPPSILAAAAANVFQFLNLNAYLSVSDEWVKIARARSRSTSFCERRLASKFCWPKTKVFAEQNTHRSSAPARAHWAAREIFPNESAQQICKPKKKR